MSSPTVRGAFIGGVVGVVLHLIFRFITQNFVWLAVGVMLLWVLAKCSPENPKEVSKRARLNSIDRSAVVISDVKGVPTSYSTYIEAISATIQNTGKARIFDLRLYCSFKPLPPRSPSAAEASWDMDRVYTNFHYGYLHPGTAASIRLIPEANGYLKEADPNSFKCEARFDIEKSDLLKEQP